MDIPISTYASYIFFYGSIVEITLSKLKFCVNFRRLRHTRTPFIGDRTFYMRTNNDFDVTIVMFTRRNHAMKRKDVNDGNYTHLYCSCKQTP